MPKKLTIPDHCTCLFCNEPATIWKPPCCWVCEWHANEAKAAMVQAVNAIRKVPVKVAIG